MAKKAPVKTVAKKAATKKVATKKLAAKKAPAKKAAAAKTAPNKSSLAFAKTNKPITPMRPRPLSPHLSIYRPQMTSVLSIVHRGTGVILYIGAFVLAWLIVCLGYGESCFIAARALFDTTLGSIAVYAFLFCLFYHLCNGIRHLAWDMGEGFELHAATLSGFLVLITSISLTSAIWFLLHPEALNQIRSMLML